VRVCLCSCPVIQVGVPFRDLADPKILSYVVIVNFCHKIKANARIRAILSFFDYNADKKTESETFDPKSQSPFGVDDRSTYM
jgi:hypothetical protein